MTTTSPLRRVLNPSLLCQLTCAVGFVAIAACNADDASSDVEEGPAGASADELTSYDANGVAAKNVAVTVSGNTATGTYTLTTNRTVNFKAVVLAVRDASNKNFDFLWNGNVRIGWFGSRTFTGTTTLPVGKYTASAAYTLDGQNWFNLNKVAFEVGGSGGTTDAGAPPPPPPPADGGPTGTSSSPLGPVGSWNLVFEDNFNGSSLDPNYWKTSWYNGVNNTSLSAANAVVSGGNLALTLSSSTVGAGAFTGPVTDRFGFKVGAPCVVEARILFPGDGKNIYNWPGFWTLDDSRVGGAPVIEIDVAEIWDGVLQTNYHPEGGASPSHNYSGYFGGAFHTWTMHRTLTQDYFYIDGKLLYTLPVDSHDTGLPQYLLFNNGIQGSHQKVPATMLIDYVRAWVPTVGGGKVVNPHGGFPG